MFFYTLALLIAFLGWSAFCINIGWKGAQQEKGLRRWQGPPDDDPQIKSRV